GHRQQAIGHRKRKERSEDRRRRGRGRRCHTKLNARSLQMSGKPDRFRDDGYKTRHSDLSACITSTRAARAAGNMEATTATASSTTEATTTGKAPGICTSRKYLPARRASTNPNAAPARTPAIAITAPSVMTPLRIRFGSDPSARRMPNSRVRALTEKASTPATPTTAINNATAANTLNTSEFKPCHVI